MSVAVRNDDFSGNQRIALGRARMFETYFHMPVIPDFVQHLEVAGASLDGIWAMSYGKHGHITEELRREATAASIAYLRRFLPEILLRKSLTAEALEWLSASE